MESRVVDLAKSLQISRQGSDIAQVTTSDARPK
jgi:hypothetical protein